VDNIRKAFKESANRYNLRSRTYTFKVDEEVLRRNFTLSDASKKVCSKFNNKFVKAKVVEVKGNCLYRLRDEATGKENVYHSKDIKRFKI